MTGGSDRGFSYDGEPIEPELAAIARRLDHDGGTWRRGLPDEQRAARRAIVALSTAIPTVFAQGVGPMTGAPTRPAEQGVPSRPSGAQGPNQTRHRGPRRAPRLLAVAAMLVVVILLVVVLKALGARQAGPHPTATLTATSAPTATSTPSFPGAWSVAGTFATPSLPNVAPSDPRVAYYTQLQTPGRTGTSTTAVTLQRTDDAGKTWQTLPLPTGFVVDNNLLGVNTLVSPLDPRTVFLYSARQAASCTPQGDRGPHALATVPHAPLPGAGTCLAQYRSTDGGASWAPLSLPAAGVLWTLKSSSPGALYGTIYEPLFGAGTGAAPVARLARSTDGGASWSLIDGSLLSAQVGVSDFALGATADEVYLVSQSTAPSAQLPPYTQHYQLWHTSDAGADWTLVGDLPHDSIAAVPLLSGNALYLVPPASGQAMQAGIFQLSTNGGSSWASVPDTGLPAGLSLANVQPVVAGGGRLIVPYVDRNDTVFYAWVPGAASWTQVAPSLLREQISQLFAVATGGTTTLWAVYGTLASFALA